MTENGSQALARLGVSVGEWSWRHRIRGVARGRIPANERRDWRNAVGQLELLRRKWCNQYRGRSGIGGKSGLRGFPGWDSVASGAWRDHGGFS
jgi:hypothetical protein